MLAIWPALAAYLQAALDLLRIRGDEASRVLHQRACLPVEREKNRVVTTHRSGYVNVKRRRVGLQLKAGRDQALQRENERLPRQNVLRVRVIQITGKRINITEGTHIRQGLCHALVQS